MNKLNRVMQNPAVELRTLPTYQASFDELVRRCEGLGKHAFLDAEAMWTGTFAHCLTCINKHSKLFNSLSRFPESTSCPAT